MIDVSKPLDLKSLVIGFPFKIAMDPTNSTPNNAEPNHGTFNYVDSTTVAADGSAQTNGYDCEMMLTTK